MPEPRPVAPGLFAAGADGPRLLAAVCRDCRRPHFPAGSVCPYCGADGCEETRVGPDARLYLFTAVHSRPPGYRGKLPYGFGVVELPGGLRVVTRLTEARPERLRPDMPMRLVVDEVFTDDEGRPVLCWAFRPEDT